MDGANFKQSATQGAKLLKCGRCETRLRIQSDPGLYLAHNEKLGQRSCAKKAA